MTQRRILIVNADDFGLTAGVNRGIVEAYERGIVTSASLMVRHAAAPEAAEYARDHERLGAGLHLDLGEWTLHQGQWHTRYEVVPLDDQVLVEKEVLRQLDEFRRLVGREPTHLDSHQHVHRTEPLRGTVKRLARRLGLPLRHFAPGVRYCGAFYGQSDAGETCAEWISTDALLGILQSLPAGPTELACHPGYPDDLASDYLQERFLEQQALCAPEIRTAIDREGIQLRCFANLEAMIH